MKQRNTELFPHELAEQLASQFHFLNEDPYGNPRLFFENSGGSLRLKAAVEAQTRLSALPDCPERTHDIALGIRDEINKGEEDIRLFLNAKSGTIASSFTASKIMFDIVSVLGASTKNRNIVTTAVEHPSSYDACKFASEANGHELRVAAADPKSGSIPLANILELVDDKTVLVSVIMTSNITGAVHDIGTYAAAIRKKNPDTFIVVDAVQGAPHGPVDVDSWGIDALNIAPYKMFGNRGVGFAFLSDRVASLPHHRLLASPKNNWNVGSPTPAHYASFSAIIDYICDIGRYFTENEDRRSLIAEGMQRIHLQEQALLHRLLHGSANQPGTKQIENVTVHFEEANGVNQDLILALTFNNMSCAEAVDRYGEHGVLVYARESSSHYSKRILEAVNLDAIVRVSPIHCHTTEDVDRFLEVTQIIAESHVVSEAGR